MQLEFQSVTYQNFLVAGAVPITIALNKYPSTLIIGPNGVGKTTFVDAWSYGLFGKPLRSLTLPKLVNSINKSDCLVTVTFTKGAATYEVRRGMKPKVFEIRENGVLLPMPTQADDYQTMLELVLGLNYKSFKQIVVLGSSSYTPFMRLPAAGRRELVEDLLDIEIFGSMNGLCKDDAHEIKTALELCSTKWNLVGEQVRMAHAYTTQLELQRLAVVDNNDRLMNDIADEIAKLQIQVIFHKCEERRYEDTIPEFHDAPDNKQMFERMMTKYENEKHRLDQDASFLMTHTECPTCTQPFAIPFRIARQKQITTDGALVWEMILKIEDALRIAKEQCVKYQTSRQALLKEARVHAGLVSSLGAQIIMYTKRLKELEAEQAALSRPQPQAPDVTALEASEQALATEQATLSSQRLIVDAAQMILKDNGIKTRVIRHYLPIINKAINHYLTALDFPILFTLDEEFDEHILSSHRKDFVYESFSDGQKQRIDLAILFAWRAIAKLKNSADTNVLVFDEVFDSSLDANGTEDFQKILQTLEDTNTFVISHKTDQLLDKFAHTLTFGLSRGFSECK